MKEALEKALKDLFGGSTVATPKPEKKERPKVITLDDALKGLFGTAQEEGEKPVPVKENFPLQEYKRDAEKFTTSQDTLRREQLPQREYMTNEDYTRVKVRHWKEEYILPEITNHVAVGLYALFRAYHAERRHSPLCLNTSYVYLREDTGEFISAEERKKLGRDVHTTKILYGLQELYRRSGGGSSDYQLTLALEQLTDAGYLVCDSAGYIASEKQPERLYNADEFLSFSRASGITVSFSPTGSLTLEGDDEGAKQRLQHMLDYSRSLGIPDTLRCTVIDRLKGRPVFYDEP